MLTNTSGTQYTMQYNMLKVTGLHAHNNNNIDNNSNNLNTFYGDHCIY